jgi:hypothetical protein
MIRLKRKKKHVAEVSFNGSEGVGLHILCIFKGIMHTPLLEYTVDIAIKLRAGGPRIGVRFLIRAKDLSFSIASRRIPGPAQSASQRHTRNLANKIGGGRGGGKTDHGYYELYFTKKSNLKQGKSVA